jgi:hypothetical protein
LLLFIDRLAMHSWMDTTADPPRRKWSVSLPVLLTDRGASRPPSDASPQRWVLDTAFTGDTFAWRYHLQQGGLDPDREIVGTARARTPLATARFPIRAAALWLVSNFPTLHRRPFRLALDPGITFRNTIRQPDAGADAPLVGMHSHSRRVSNPNRLSPGDLFGLNAPAVVSRHTAISW